MTTGVACPVVIPQFTLNNGQLAAGGYIAPTVGGVPTAVYQDSGLTVPLPLVSIPNQSAIGVPLNSRGEISNAQGASCQLFLTPNVTYTFTLYDASGNQIWVASYVNGVQLTAAQAAELISGITNSPVLASYTQTAAEMAAGVTPINYSYPPGCVDRYGINASPGVTDMSTAVRAALNSVPLGGGMIYFLTNNVYFLGSVIYIPQRMAGPGKRGTIIEGNNATLIGNGLGSGATGSGNFTTLASGSIPSAMFETGTGIYSTASNYGLGNEQSTTLHYGDVIRNLRFINFGVALHLFNFTASCKLENLIFEMGYSAVVTNRCFYLSWDTLAVFFQQSGAGRSGYAAINLIDTTNDCGFFNVKVVGTYGTTPTALDIGWQMSMGVQGCGWFSSSAEQCYTGVNNQGQINGAMWVGGYFESNNTAINLGSNNVTMKIAGNDFIGSSQPVAITGSAWVQGRLETTNNFDSQSATNNTVVLTAITNTCTVEIPPQYFTEAASVSTALQTPAGFQLGGSVQIEGRRIVYASAVGANAELIAEDLSNTGPPRFAYSGGPVDEGLQTGSWLPFCTQGNTSGSSTFLTQINWSAYRMIVAFDLYGTITSGGSGNIQVSGLVFAGGLILRADTNTASYTVVAANQSGKLLLTVNGSGFSGKTASWQGQIRHV